MAIAALLLALLAFWGLEMPHDDFADELIKRFQRVENDRGIWETHWRQIAERVLPRADDFAESRAPGEKRTELLFDATAPLALDRFAAAMESMLTPRAAIWHKLSTGDDQLDDVIDNRRWLDDVNDVLFRARYAASANFASQSHEAYMSLGGFGTGGYAIQDVGLGRMRYQTMPLSGFYIQNNSAGMVDTLWRKRMYTARQALQKWPQGLPEKILAAANSERDKDKEFTFISTVLPNEELDRSRADFRGMEVASIWVSLDERQVVEKAGFNSFPFAVSRYVTAPNETYGRSPAMLVLADIKTLNEMVKTTLRAAHKAVDPPVLLFDDGVLNKFSNIPGAMNYGGIDQSGRPLALPFQSGANIPLGLEMEDQKRGVINDAFLVTLFQILVDQPQMTATEALLRAQEKGALLAPTVGRQQSELLGPQIDRELDIQFRAGKLPPMPVQIAEMMAEGERLKVEYESPITRAQRAEEGIALLRTLEGIAPMAQLDPTILDKINGDEALEMLASVNGLPAKILRTDDEVEALRGERAQAEQAQALLEAAPVAADAAKSAAEAQAASQQARF